MAFNTDNALDKSLSDWCDQQSPNNFSGFIKMVLYAHKNGAGANLAPQQPVKIDSDRGIMSIL